MPQTFCHLDAFHINTFFRAQDDIEEMVLIDWSCAGLAAPGEELAALCVAVQFLDPTPTHNLDEIEQATFDAYISGLRDAGWKGAEEDVWRAYRSAAILRYGSATLYPLLPVLMNEETCRAMAGAIGVPFDRFQDHVARHCRAIANRAGDV